MQTLFDIAAFERTGSNTNPSDHFCRTCQYRVRGKTDEHATRYEQYCIKQRTKRNTVGYKKIKVTNAACIYYSEKQQDDNGH